MRETGIRIRLVVWVVTSLCLAVLATLNPSYSVSTLSGLVGVAVLTWMALAVPPVAIFAAGAVWLVGASFGGLTAVAHAVLAALGPVVVLASATRARIRDSVARRIENECADSRERQMIHDLRTPLNAVNGAFELLSRRDLDERGRKYVDLGLNSVGEMTVLLQPSDTRGNTPGRRSGDGAIDR